MRAVRTERGFGLVVEERHANEGGEFTRLVQESSAIGDYPDSWDKPGSSFLWIGEDHQLNREQVEELAGYLRNWLDTGRLLAE